MFVKYNGIDCHIKQNQTASLSLAIFDTAFRMENFRILVRGACVGNRHIIHQVIHGYCVGEYDPWIDNKCVINVDDKPVQLQLNHLYGGGDFWPVVRGLMRNCDGFLLTYAINDRESFDEVKEQYRRIVDVRGTKNVPIVLCGNKCDLDDQRVVSRTEGEELAKDLGAIFIETSAFANIRVDAIFKALVREIRKKAIPKEQPAEAKNKDRDKQCILL